MTKFDPAAASIPGIPGMRILLSLFILVCCCTHTRSYQVYNILRTCLVSYNSAAVRTAVLVLRVLCCSPGRTAYDTWHQVRLMYLHLKEVLAPAVVKIFSQKGRARHLRLRCLDHHRVRYQRRDVVRQNNLNVRVRDVGPYT